MWTTVVVQKLRTVVDRKHFSLGMVNHVVDLKGVVRL